MKRGFTLIELLAVIVILAIIALIAVPIVLNIINDSKTSSDEQTVELYLDTVEKTITKKQLSDSNFDPDKCEIQSNGSLECFKENKSLGILEIDIKGKAPDKGTFEIKNNKFKYKNIWFNGKKYYAIATLLDDADNNGEISIGDKYSYRVNDKYIFNFYILTEPYNGEVNLIMDRNICEDGTTNYNEDNNYCKYEWYFDQNNLFGPVKAMTKLYKATKNWDNVLDMNLSGTKAYYDEGSRYGKVETIENGIKITKNNNEEVNSENGTTPAIPYEDGKRLKARLPKYNEVSKEDNSLCTGDYGTCPVWLVDNLLESTEYSRETYPKKNNMDNNIGYWILSSYSNSSYGSYYAYSISYDGQLTHNYKSNNYIGVRPVIKVLISDLE